MLKNILICGIMSMVPVIELRGALPVGIAMGLNPIFCYLLCVVCNMIPVPFIILFIRQILEWMGKQGGILKKTSDWVLNRAQKKLAQYEKYETAGLFIFVAVPLPGTGAWTGALIAAILGMRLKHALPSIFLGVMAAGAIMLLVSLGVVNLAF